MKIPTNGHQIAMGEVLEGFLYSYRQLDTNALKTYEVSVQIYSLIELLVEKGFISTEELDEHKKAVEKRLQDSYKEAEIGVRVQNVGVDKYSLEGDAEIDCEKRLPICRAACCTLAFALSLQDIHEGIRWSLGKPFMNAREEDGYCINLERDTCKCRIYKQRPAVCRQYDCRNDRRIWLDFNAMTINPALFAKGDSPCIEVNSEEETHGDEI